MFVIGHKRGRKTNNIFPLERTEIIGKPAPTLAEVLENNVSKKYLLSEAATNRLLNNGIGFHSKVQNSDTAKLASTLCASDYKLSRGMNLIEVRPVLTPNRLNKRQNGRRFKEPGEPMFTLTKQDIHGIMISRPSKSNIAILRSVRTDYGKQIRKKYESGEIKESRHNMTKLEPRGDGISNTITTVQKDNLLLENCRIRRLTPKECWRLQGIPDEITDKVIAAGISDTQMYKGAGDATTVNVIYEIAKRM